MNYEKIIDQIITYNYYLVVAIKEGNEEDIKTFKDAIDHLIECALLLKKETV